MENSRERSDYGASNEADSAMVSIADELLIHRGATPRGRHKT